MTCKLPLMTVVGMMMILLSAADFTSDVLCLDSCVGKENGDYASCKGCNYFETCSNGIMYTTKCQSGLEFHQGRDKCVWAPSSTCCFNDHATLSATCDNIMAVYVDGVQATPNNAFESDWSKSSDYPLHACNSLVAISCEDFGVKGGILASTTTGVKTDTTWRCTDQLEAGWETVGFTETAGVWGTPGTYGVNAASPSPWNVFLASINPSAEWIWYGANAGAAKTVYCRKNI